MSCSPRLQCGSPPTPSPRSTTTRPPGAPAPAASLRPVAGLPFAAALVLTTLLTLVATSSAWAQGWEDDDWGDPGAATTWTGTGLETAWYLRGGIGFTADPDELLLNFELAHQFDQYISFGPMLQIGVADNRSIWAPTANLTITVPDMPGEDLDNFHPFLFAGIGVGVLENGDRGGRADTRQTGFLVNTGLGVDYALNEQLSVGTRVIFNFLPGRTLNEDMFYSWEIVGFKFAF